MQQIPAHLQAYIVEQDYELYTPMDHAAWRMILRLSQKFFAENAHQKYLDGLNETGISIERIPRISEMDALLQKFNWRAVAVSGFIPPAIFMEFFSRAILPIACDMRMIENLTYTPAPDIVHEAAGHAPIIADPAYSDYLRRYGDVSTKAIFNQRDIELYLAVRNLSEVKENPRAGADEIKVAQDRLDRAAQAMGEPSEAALLARMNWWTVEYGLVGDVRAPKIYGAGLLSSLAESYHCLEAKVAKIPLTVDCITVSYDITRPQPQLFVARDFAHLTEVLDEFGATMAYRVGGERGMQKAIEANALVTIVLDSGLQISGKLTDFAAARGEITFLKCEGKVQLSFHDVEIPGHGTRTHAQGFSSPMGAVHGRDLSSESFEKLQKHSEWMFESGYRLHGKLMGETRLDGERLLLSFEQCTVWNPAGEVIYQPAWGTFDLAIGSRVTSVFGGAADLVAYLGDSPGSSELLPSKPRQKSNLTEENRQLNQYYQRLRIFRESPRWDSAREMDLLQLSERLETEYPRDWLLKFEICEVLLEPRGWSEKLLNLRSRWLSDLRALSKTKTPEGEVLTRAFQFLMTDAV